MNENENEDGHRLHRQVRFARSPPRTTARAGRGHAMTAQGLPLFTSAGRNQNLEWGPITVRHQRRLPSAQFTALPPPRRPMPPGTSRTKDTGPPRRRAGHAARVSAHG